MDIKLLHLHPELMSLYGDWANVALLRRHLGDLGHTVTVEQVSLGDDLDLSGADFLFLGAGTERSQKAVLEDLRRHGPALAQAAEENLPMLFTGTAFELLGRQITDAAGTVYPALGLMDFTVTETKKRIVEDVIGDCPCAGAPLVGFMNKCSHITGVETPLLTACEMGFGNDAPGGAEGICFHQVLGTHLTGPVLVKNPALSRAVIRAILARRGAEEHQEWPAYPYEEQGYQVTLQELRRRMAH